MSTGQAVVAMCLRLHTLLDLESCERGLLLMVQLGADK